MPEYRSIGKPIPRPDSSDKVRGEAVFGADVVLPRMLVAKFLPSRYAHAEIVSIDTSQAEALPGVHAVLTRQDLPTPASFDPWGRFYAYMARQFAVFIGQPVAAVAAEDLATAEAALDLIRVEYRPLPVVIDPRQAVQPDSFPIGREPAELQTHEAVPGRSPNVGETQVYKYGDLEAAFAAADLVVEATYSVPVVHQSYIEPHAHVAYWDRPGHVSVWEPTQGAFSARNMLARVLGMPHTNITINSTEIGGGFGGKIEGLYAPIAILLAKKARRPVRLVLTRREELMATNPAPQSFIHIKTGVTKEGRLTAVEAEVLVDAGAFPNGWIMSSITQNLRNNYRFDAWRVKGTEALTNKASIAAYRAPGGPNVAFAMESHMDEIASRLGMDPLELRLQNLVSEGDLLTGLERQKPTGARQVLQALVDRGAWKVGEPHRVMGEDGWLCGRGLALGYWEAGGGPAGAIAILEADGRFRIVLGTVDLTGSFTSLAQIAAEALGVSSERVVISKASTDFAPFAPESAGSQTIYAMGSAVLQACQVLRRKVLDLAAQTLAASPEALATDDEGVYLAANPEQRLGFATLYQFGSEGSDISGPLVGEASAAQRRSCPNHSASVAEVAVDPQTGVVKLLRLVTAQDVGLAINPLSVEGQIQGGSTQSASFALWEEVQYAEDGQVRNPGLLDYRLPTSADMPPVEAIIVEGLKGDGPYGAKVVGEPSIIPPVAAVANAVAAAIGARVYDTPLTPERVWRALQAKGTGG